MSATNSQDQTQVDTDLRAINARLLGTFGKALLPSLVAVFSTVAVASLVAFLLIALRGTGDSWGQILAIHLVQVWAGLVLSLFCLFLGAMMCWFGVTGTFTLNAEGGGTKLNLQAAQVGIILLVGGLLVGLISLHKSVQSVEESGAVSNTPAGKSITTRKIATAPPASNSPYRNSSPDELKAAQAAIGAAEDEALSGAVDAAARAASQVDDPKAREAASRVVNAVDVYAKARAKSREVTPPPG
jgi:hypothetical protein